MFVRIAVPGQIFAEIRLQFFATGYFLAQTGHKISSQTVELMLICKVGIIFVSSR